MDEIKIEQPPKDIANMNLGEIGVAILNAMTDNEENDHSVFSKENIKKIYSLVLHGYELPTTIEEVQQMMPFQDGNELNYQNYLELFNQVKSFSLRWHYFESDIISQTLLLSAFSSKFCEALEDIISRIERLSIYEKCVQSLDRKTLTFSNNDLNDGTLIISPLYGYMYGTRGIKL